MKNKYFNELLESINQARQIKKLNRIKKLRSKRVLVWCKNCDTSLVAIGRKCRICQKRTVK